MGRHWHVHRKWDTELVITILWFIIGFAILIAGLIYMGSRTLDH